MSRVLFVCLSTALLVLLPPTHASGQECDAEILADITSAAGSVSPEEVGEMVSIGLIIACPGLPAGLKGTLEKLSQLPPDRRGMLIMQGLTRDPSLLREQCGDVPGALLAWQAAAPGEKAKASGCRFASLASPEEIAGVDGSMALLALALHGWFEAQSISDGREVARLLMGLDLPAQAPKKNDFKPIPEIKPLNLEVKPLKP